MSLLIMPENLIRKAEVVVTSLGSHYAISVSLSSRLFRLDYRGGFVLVVFGVVTLDDPFHSLSQHRGL